MSENKTLLQLSADARSITQMIIQNGGELTEEVMALLEGTEKQLATKVDAYAELLEVCDADVAYWKEKAKVFQAAARGIENLKERVKERIKFVMESSGESELKGTDYRFKLSPTKDRVEYFEAQIPDSYKVQVVSTELDKEKIKEDLDLGIDIPGVVKHKSHALRSYINKGVK
jgi:hypothetical protein